MKKVFSFLLVLLFSALTISAKTKIIKVTSNEGARIFVNGNEVGNSATVIIKNNGETAYVRVEKPGFITAVRQYSFLKSKKELPDNDYIQLEADEAYTGSDVTDQANRDIDLKTTLSEDEAWKLISRIVTNYFDVIEVTDKTTGYLRTAWVVKKFNGGSVRTRIIIKTGSSNPLSYKIKLSSEIASTYTESTTDEVYKSWGRVLRFYDGIISEMQNRLNK